MRHVPGFAPGCGSDRLKTSSIRTVIVNCSGEVPKANHSCFAKSDSSLCYQHEEAQGIILAVVSSFSYSVAMPYVFPYEDFFIGGVACVILGLLLVRVIVAKKQKEKGRETDE